jgi:tetratricopeptide (TPR) repeat protein
MADIQRLVGRARAERFGALPDAVRNANFDALMRQMLVIEAKTYGPRHPQLALSIREVLGPVSSGLPVFETYYREALDIDVSALGESSPYTFQGDVDLANFLERDGRYAEAEPYRRNALKAAETLLKPCAEPASKAEALLARNLDRQGRDVEAESLYRKAIQIALENLANEKDPALVHEDYEDLEKDYSALAMTMQSEHRERRERRS